MSVSPEVDHYLSRRRSRIGFFFNDTYAALALVVATLAALVWANIGTSYEDFWATKTSIDLGFFEFKMTFHAWVDEFLMALFFLVIGLDVRRELSIGELRMPGRMLLPVVAAVSGLVVPAVIFLVLNGGGAGDSAWGTVISTDTAFALGMLALIGPKNAPRLRVFLLAVAVVDDIAALIVIAVVYTAGLNFVALGVAAVGLVGIFLLQRAGVWRLSPYFALGIVVWVAVYASGVHATIAGVLIALLMPVYDVRRRDVSFVNEIFGLFRQSPSPVAAQTLRETLVHAIPLNQRLGASLPPYVSFIVVPLFALANAGIGLSPKMLGDAVGSPLTWGVILGLVLGKMVGVASGAAVVMKLVPQSKLPGLDLPRVLGIGALSGMGFTISLLVVGLALDDPQLQAQARIGVLVASVLALVLATVIFRLGDRFAPLSLPDGERLPRAVDVETDHIFGDADAPVTLVIYTAMNTTYREGLARSIKEAVNPLLDSGRVRIVYRHRITNSTEVLAALALEAAGRQGSFCAMHDALVDTPEELDMDAILRAAGRLGLDTQALRKRVDRAADEVAVDDDTIDGVEVEGSEPVVFLQGERIPSAENAWHLTRRIDEAEATVEA